MNWEAPLKTGEASPGKLIDALGETRTVVRSSAEAGDWLCAWCLNRVAHEKDRLQYGGKDEFTFVNPAGIEFEIITFSETLGCCQSGVPTLKDTWFPGCAWSFCQCNCCGHHLGWNYDGPHQFVGLIKNRIVRALHVRN